MTKKTKDPFHKREQEKYDNPIPSREFIMMVLEDFGRPITLSQIIKNLDIDETSKQEALNFRLRAMLRDGQLMQDRRGRYCLFERINLRRGTIQAHPDGYGFFISNTEEPDMMISAAEMRGVMHGDVVLAFQTSVDRRGRLEGKIHEVIEHANASVVGRFFSEHGVSYVVPDSKRLTQDISVPTEHTLGAQNGQIVLLEILAFPNKRSQAVGKVVNIVGEHMAPGMEIEISILAHSIPYDWPDDVNKEVAKIKQSVEEQDLNKRSDLRDLPFVTIDGADAKDFDDAVYCVARPKGGFILYVAIADVSHYVPIDSALDKEGARRGNSVYFPGKVIPMLPEALSNGICSLNPNVDRLCMVAEMTISAEGKIGRSRFYRAVIHSKARLTYDQVNEWMIKGSADEHSSAFWPAIQDLILLYRLLHQLRKQRGAMDFDTVETQIEFDANRKIQRIKPSIRNDAHKLIEECMLAANMATAKFLEKSKIPALYRVHPAPEEDKILGLRKFLSEFGLKLPGGKQPTPKDFQHVLGQLDDKPERHLIQTVMLRSLKQATYIECNEGHFGLAYSAYTHFTSPIRRYPDLLVHRAVGHLIDNQPADTFVYTDEDMSRLGKFCSATERRADEATREAVTWLKCEYMLDKVGQVFSGKISAVTSFGIFVELNDIYVEGLIHVTALKSDYYTFDAAKHRLVGERSGHTFRLGDPMTVLVARVDLTERKIEFDPVFNETFDE